MHYISDIYNFCYLKKRKEIFLLTELDSYEEKKKTWGMARADLLGNIIYYNKISLKFIINTSRSPFLNSEIFVPLN